MSEIKFTFREKENAVDFASGGKMEGKGCIFQLLVHGGVHFVRVCCYVCGGGWFHGAGRRTHAMSRVCLCVTCAIEDTRTPFLSTHTPKNTTTVSSTMQELPPDEILWGPYALERDQKAVEEYLSYLVPSRLQIQVVSKVRCGFCAWLLLWFGGGGDCGVVGG